MALVSPGVEVTIIDESQYAPTAVGTTAYLLIATAENKTTPGGTAIAQGTLVENAEEIYNVTSQRELVNLFGSPSFQTTIAGGPIHGDERNEYGLMAAYNLLGISNSVYVQRADVDLNGLSGSPIRPVDDMPNNTFWLDTSETSWGIEEWVASGTNANTFQRIVPTVLARDTAPDSSYGVLNDYVVTVGAGTTDEIHFYKKVTSGWVEVGTDAWKNAVFTPSVTSNVDAGTSGVNTITVTGGGSGNITINGSIITIADGDDFDSVNTAINSESITGVTSEITTDDVLVITATSTATNGNLVITVDANLSTNLGIGNTSVSGPTTLSAPYFENPNWRGNVTVANRPTGSIWQKTSIIGNGLNLSVKKYNGVTEVWEQLGVGSYANVFAATYALDRVGGGRNITQGTVFSQYDVYADDRIGNYLWHRRSVGETVVTGSTTSPSNVVVDGNAVLGGNVDIPSFTITTRTSTTSQNQTTANIIPTGTYNASANATTITVDNIIAAINSSNISSVVSATLDSVGALVLTHRQGGDFYIAQNLGNVGSILSNIGIDETSVGITTSLTFSDVNSGDSLIGSNWQPLSIVGSGVRGITGDAGYVISNSLPTREPLNNTLWYNNDLARVDIMYNDGLRWRGYRTITEDQRGYNLSNTDPNGVLIATDAPTEQTDGTALEYGDIWLDSNDFENYPALYRWERVEGVDQWVTIDKSDPTSPNGLIFADIRWGTSDEINPAIDDTPSIEDLLTNSHVDLDAPDPRLNPRGILAFNTRASGYGVKQYKTNYFIESNYPEIPEHLQDIYSDLPTESSTWLTVSGVDDEGLPNFGRKAQRGVVVSAFKAAIDSSTKLREESNVFNLIACPGYPELIPNMVSLNEERDNTAFIVGDPPLRLVGNGTAIQEWANNPSGFPTGEKGLNISSPYVGIYYPHGLTNDLDGNTIAMPSSYAALRTIVRSDQASYPWFAPAGTRRGIIDNFSAIGYLNEASGRFITFGVTPGLRDVMYQNKINPLTTLPGTGIVVYGQKTLNPDSSALDRVNVARLVNFLRRQMAIATRPFIFEPNDVLTRNAVKAVAESLINDLVSKRGVYDYLVVCDTSNNTPDRIARNELYIDIAVQPVRAVEFIYIPIRIKNPGDLLIA